MTLTIVVRVGEGTGKARDLDEFDRHYRHLFVWNTRRQELVGAYRLARTVSHEAATASVSVNSRKRTTRPCASKVK